MSRILEIDYCYECKYRSGSMCCNPANGRNPNRPIINYPNIPNWCKLDPMVILCTDCGTEFADEKAYKAHKCDESKVEKIARVNELLRPGDHINQAGDLPCKTGG